MSAEEQIALRLPEALAKRLRYWLAQSGAPGVLPGEVLVESLDDYGQLFSFTIDGKSYPARLANMATCVDTWKTVNHQTYVKSGEVGQVIVVVSCGGWREGWGARWDGPVLLPARSTCLFARTLLSDVAPCGLARVRQLYVNCAGREAVPGRRGAERILLCVQAWRSRRGGRACSLSCSS